MRYGTLGFVASACLFGVLLIGCAGGGSSVTQTAGAVPSAVQRGTISGAALLGDRQ
jgi:hypothetical protein